MIADDRRTVEAALDIRVGADEHAVSEHERLEVLEPDAAADVQSMSAPASRGAPDAATHHDVEGAVASGEA